ncbi:hypothetical protein CMI37_09875 [Candidatus Pacearchaeota archaeon]|jgi:hypothetical protein|nr:hypothetical protein [Candidatus Pacearchaeota archaeon]
MSVNVAHTDFTDATTLFADLAAANAMLDGLTVPDATTSTDGVAKMAAIVAEPSGNSATNNQTAIIAILTSLKNAGIMSSS